MAKTVKVLKKHEIVLEGKSIRLVPLTADHQKLVKKWILKKNLIPLLFPDNGKEKSFKEKLAHGMFKGILVNTMIVHWSHNGYVFLIEKDGKPIGFTALWLLDKTKKAYRIPILITNDDNKRKGYGSEVIDILTDFIDETEESFVILVPYIPTSRQDYQAFYNKNGFTQSEGETQTTLTFHKRYVKIS